MPRNIIPVALSVVEDSIEAAFAALIRTRDNVRQDDGRGNRHARKRLIAWRYYLRRLISEQPHIKKRVLGTITEVDENRKECSASTEGELAIVDHIKYYPPNRKPRVNEKYLINFEQKLPTRTLEENSRLEEGERWIKLYQAQFLYYLDSSSILRRVPWPPPDDNWATVKLDDTFVADFSSLGFEVSLNFGYQAAIATNGSDVFVLSRHSIEPFNIFRPHTINVYRVKANGEISSFILNNQASGTHDLNFLSSIEASSSEFPQLGMIIAPRDQPVPQIVSFPSAIANDAVFYTGRLINLINSVESPTIFTSTGVSSSYEVAVHADETHLNSIGGVIQHLDIYYAAMRMQAYGPGLAWVDTNGDTITPLTLLDTLVREEMTRVRNAAMVVTRTPDPNQEEAPGMPMKPRVWIAVGNGVMQEKTLPANPEYGGQDNCKILATPWPNNKIAVYATFTSVYPWVNEGDSVNTLYRCVIDQTGWEALNASTIICSSQDGVNLIGRADEYSNIPSHSEDNSDNIGDPRWVYSIDSGEHWKDLPRPPGITSASWRGNPDDTFIVMPVFGILDMD